MADEIIEEVFDGIECLYFPYGINEEMISCKVATMIANLFTATN